MSAHISRRSAIAAITAVALPLHAIDSRQPAPKFHAKSMDGESFNNDSLKGKAVVIQFWATWCKYCRRDQPALESLVQELSSQGLVVLAVNVGESKSKVKQYLASSPRISKIVMMQDTNLAALYSAKAFPKYVAIDRAGKVAHEVTGAIGEERLREMIAKAGIEAA
ncbi:MAG TPA: TlpA disulfide reductase family protein [Candidatus Solibacter sp.]|nr:TlpA disulfide reductase family protein [Candidatus Solibacter sp.]